MKRIKETLKLKQTKHVYVLLTLVKTESLLNKINNEQTKKQKPDKL